MTKSTSLLVIGYGNSLRRDDGAGLLLADDLTRRWRAWGLSVRGLSVHQLTPDLALEMDDHAITHVVFVDAEPASTGSIRMRRLPNAAGEVSLGHQMDPAMVMAYDRQLFGHDPAAYIVTVPGTDFGFGEELSPRVRTLLQQAPTLAHQFLTEMAIPMAGSDPSNLISD